MLHISNDVNDTCALQHGKSGKQVVVVVFGVPVNILWDGRALRVKPAEVGGEGRYRARTSFSLCFFCSVVLEGGGWVYLILAAKGGGGKSQEETPGRHTRRSEIMATSRHMY